MVSFVATKKPITSWLSLNGRPYLRGFSPRLSCSNLCERLLNSLDKPTVPGYTFSSGALGAFCAAKKKREPAIRPWVVYLTSINLQALSSSRPRLLNPEHDKSAVLMYHLRAISLYSNNTMIKDDKSRDIWLLSSSIVILFAFNNRESLIL